MQQGNSPILLSWESIPQCLFPTIPLYVTRFSKRFSFEEHACGWAALEYISSPSAVMTLVMWLVGAIRVGWWAGGERAKYYAQMSLHNFHRQLHQPSPFATTWCLNTHFSPLLLSLWFMCELQHGHHFSHCTMQRWALRSLDECRKRCWVGCLTNNQSKGIHRAAVWPYCSPIKSPQILTDVKVQAQAVGCLLTGDKVSSNSSAGGCIALFTCSGGRTPCCCSACALQMLLLHPQ